MEKFTGGLVGIPAETVQFRLDGWPVRWLLAGWLLAGLVVSPLGIGLGT